MKMLTRSWYFWAGLVILTAGSLVFTRKYAPKALKIINVNLTMSREQAVQEAEKLSQKNQWEPRQHQTAISFQQDRSVQLFTELECGGEDTFLTMVKEHLYEPYTWKVRHFQEYQVHETVINFTPDGRPYGFTLKLPEDEKRENLSVAAARKLAEREALEQWDIDFSRYKPFETSKNELPCGRIDHTFVYEREDEQLGKEGRYRLKLVVSGDTLTQVTPFVHIPESFSRHYQEMRTSNDGIAYLAFLAQFLIYLALGGLVGGFLLFRQRLLLTKQPLFWATCITVLQIASSINQFPLLWMHYQTSTSALSFIVGNIFRLIITFFYFFCLTFIAFSAGEGLTRVAFPHLIQFWKTWSDDNAASFSVAGQTIGAYLGAFIKLACVIGIYLILLNQCGWWAPGATLIDPNIIATYFPPLGSLGSSLFAGFFEECTFRAIPLAGAALIGRKFKKEKLFIIGALIFQAIVFGAAHANYTVFPSYFRIVELFPISIGYGLIYLTYGLLPVILIHWIYDFVLMSLPIFVSQAAGMWIHKLFVITFGAVPLFIVFYQRIRLGRWKELARSAYNKAWKRQEAQQELEEIISTEKVVLTPSRQKTVLVAGFVGLTCWALFTDFKNYDPTLLLSRSEATAIAKAHLRQVDPLFYQEAKPVCIVMRTDDQQAKFVWQKLGKQWYAKLLGIYLVAHHYSVRFTRHTGTMEQRTEEYIVRIDHAGSVINITHKLPEVRPGEQLSEQAARKKALEAVSSNFSLSKDSIKEISAIARQLPERRDWSFIFEDTGQTLPAGKAYLKVTLAGDTISSYERFIHVPEDWKRKDQNQSILQSLVRSSRLIFLLLLCAVGLAFVLPIMLRKKSILPFLLLMGGICVIEALNFLNQSAQLTYFFNTAQSFFAQFFMSCIVSMIVISASSFLTALLICALCTYPQKTRLKRSFLTPWVALSCSFLLEGTFATICGIFSLSIPHSFDSTPLNAFFPSITFLSGAIQSLIFTTTCLFLLWLLCTRTARLWGKNNPLPVLLSILYGIAAASSTQTLSPSIMCASGIATGVVFYLLYRLVLERDCTLLPIVVAGSFSLKTLELMIQAPYLRATLYGSAAICIVVILAFFWYKKLGESKTEVIG